METFIIWAIISAITGGLYHFGFKVITERGYSSYEATLWSYAVASVISLFFLFSQGFGGVNSQTFFYIFLLSFGNILFFYISVILRIESMKNIDNVIFYPLFKTFGPIIVTGFSLFYFRESLTLIEGIGILTGITVPLMLLTQSESKRQKNLSRGVIFMLLAAASTSICTIFVKLSNNFGYDIFTFITISFLVGVVFSIIGVLRERKQKKKFNRIGIHKFGILIGIVHFLTFFTYVKAFEGNMAIAYTINSFSILIPIILSIIFYGEHFNAKKGVVILLSIVSILLFL